MVRVGGSADKIGNRYEVKFTVLQLLRILNGNYDYIILEPTGEEGKKIEFYLGKDQEKHFYQVKRQLSKSDWPLSNLISEGIITNFFQRIRNNDNNYCYFVSTVDSFELKEITNRARSSTSSKDFFNEKLSIELNKVRKTIRTRFKNYSEEEIFFILQRIRMIQFNEEFTLDELINLHIKNLFQLKEPKQIQSIYEFLFKLCLDTLDYQRKITNTSLTNELEKNKFIIKNWKADSSIVLKITNHNNIQSLLLNKKTINGQVINTGISNHVIEEIKKTELIFLTAPAGYGKSVTMNLIAQEIKKRNLPYIYLSLDQIDPNIVSLNRLVDALDLGISPFEYLSSGLNQNGYLILDQFESIQYSKLFRTFFALIKSTLIFSNIKIIIAIREQEFNDPQIKIIKDMVNGFKEIKINKLSKTLVDSIINDISSKFISLTPRQYELFSNPLHLHLLSEIFQANAINNDVLSFDTISQLFDEYMDYKQRYLEENGVTETQWNCIMSNLTEYMFNEERLYIPEKILTTNCGKKVVDKLLSYNVIIKNLNQIKFFHESFFDYIYSRLYLSSGKTVIQFLNESQQSLFHRPLVNQLITFCQEIDFEKYLQVMDYILTGESVRVHLVFLLFNFIQKITNPTLEEWQIIHNYLRIENFNYKDHLWWSICQQSWFTLLYSNGIISNLIKDQNIVNIIKMSTNLDGDGLDQFIDLVSPLIDDYCSNPREDEKKSIIKNIFLVNKGNFHKSRLFYEKFLEILKFGVFYDFDEDNLIISNCFDLIHNLSKINATWACEAVEIILEYLITYSDEKKSKNPFDLIKDFQPYLIKNILENLSLNSPKDFMERIFPLMERILQNNFEQIENSNMMKDSIWQHYFFLGMNKI